jgi:hypothetical protein
LENFLSWAWRDFLDDLRDVLGVSAGGGTQPTQNDKDQPEANSGTHEEFLLVNGAFHASILAVFCPRYTSVLVTR